MSVNRVYLSIGSNVDPDTHVVRAIEALTEAFGPLALSRVYRNPAVGFDGSDFLNLVVGFDTGHDPFAIAERIHAIESANGRLRSGPKFSSRTLDIDLLTHGRSILRQGRLVLPRDEILRYAFVLQPLAELAGDELHPETGASYGWHWRRFCDRWGQPQMVEVLLPLPPAGAT